MRHDDKNLSRARRLLLFILTIRVLFVAVTLLIVVAIVLTRNTTIQMPFDKHLRDISLDSVVGLFIIVSMFCLFLSKTAKRLRYFITYASNHDKAAESPDCFFLVLRSFRERDLYEHVREVEYDNPGDDWSGTIFHYYSNFMRHLERVLRDHGMLVMMECDVGLDYDHAVVVLNYRDVDWKKDFELLALSCRAIFVFPGTTQSLQYELDFIKGEDLLKKTIFLLPPAIRYFDGTNTIASLRSNWNTLEKTLSRDGIALPRYCISGVMFIVGEDPVRLCNGGIQDSERIQLREDSIRQVISQISTDCIALSDIYPLLSYREKLRIRHFILGDPPGIHEDEIIYGLLLSSIIVTCLFFSIMLILKLLGP